MPITNISNKYFIPGYKTGYSTTNLKNIKIENKKQHTLFHAPKFDLHFFLLFLIDKT